MHSEDKNLQVSVRSNLWYNVIDPLIRQLQTNLI